MFGIFFNPLHGGHLDYIEAAAKQCNHLAVIVNNDEQVQLKGSKPFMKVDERLRIVDSLWCVEYTLVSLERDVSNVAKSVAYIVAMYREYYDNFVLFNSGDRNPGTWPAAEKETCDLLGVKTEFLELPKTNSSSEILRRFDEMA